ncbi:hypothetical protein [Cupriavidus sp. SS-3]|uniref:hypothetical protein n=1 Tax=Cupriavidus sp. SS-3 TaxID=3109596 RepID=UPI002DB8A5EE|nr:hypothetical protein [Cupriavidus sp. SS-3]MEC3764983.1 hypothetical protein [Cupriavidus sp. SS-3]
MTGDTMCQIEGEELVIRVRIDALAAAAEIILPELLGIDPLRERPVKVTDPLVWANEVVNTLLEEGEIGQTRITNMFDEAFEHALEYGAEGIEVEEAPEEDSDD